MGEEMEEIIRHLKERFPMLTRLRVRLADRDAEIERPPAYVGLLLSVMADRSTGPVCFVFPRRGEVARVAAVLYGLLRFAERLPELIAEYARTSFNTGQRVRVYPSEHVFEFGGLAEDLFSQFWLRTPPTKGGLGGRRTFPMTDVLRLEVTTRKNPKGHLDTQLQAPPSAPIDDLLGERTYGNRGLFRNEVLLLDSQTAFARFAETVKLGPETAECWRSQVGMTAGGSGIWPAAAVLENHW
jgi:hypothetical protein